MFPGLKWCICISHSLQQPSLIIPLCALCPAGIHQQPFAHIYYNPLCLQTEEEDSLSLAESKQNSLFLLWFDKVAGLVVELQTGD